jgi:hypothetical protein
MDLDPDPGGPNTCGSGSGSGSGSATLDKTKPSVATFKRTRNFLAYLIPFISRPPNVFFLLKIMKVPAPPPSTTSAPSYGPAIDIDLDIDLGTPDNPIDDINLGMIFFFFNL